MLRLTYCALAPCDWSKGALDAPPGGGDWSLAEEPSAVAESVLDALEIAEDSVKVRDPVPKSFWQ